VLCIFSFACSRPAGRYEVDGASCRAIGIPSGRKHFPRHQPCLDLHRQPNDGY
jgi:hypothetical protein